MVLPLAVVQALLLVAFFLCSSTSATTGTTFARANVKDLFQDNSHNCDSCYRFDGIGGLSAGGGTARLLWDYPKDAQAEVLDFLFKPNFGASLHMLKVEIGGDSQSTDGTESSHMHSQDDLNFQRGYEWWLLREAKKRNPDILTYALPWAFPGWISEDKHNPFQHLDRLTNYTLNWVQGAKQVHNIDLDYLGIWNEAGTSREYLLALRKTLDDHGFQKVQLVTNDGQPEHFCDALVNDTDYLKAMNVLGFHYPKDDDPVWPLCHSLGLPVWSAEESSSYDDLNGAACWARVLSSHYVLSNMTSNIIWNLMASNYHGTDWYGAGMMTAVQPWTGYYEFEQMPVIWATAHYTQFLNVGWQYLPVGQGSGELAHGGYYTTLVSSDQKHFTVIVVKISRDHAQCVRPQLWNWDTSDEVFHLTIDLPGLCGDGDDATQTWYSNFEQEDTILFEKQEDLLHRMTSKQQGVCSYEIALNVTVGSVFTVTNQMKVGNKGQAQVKRESDPRFPLPYEDDFNAYECDNCYSRYLTDQMGAFEIQLVDDGSKEKRRALVQMAPELPVGWFGTQRKGPSTLLGMSEWEDVRVKTSFRLPDPASAACIATRADQKWDKAITMCVNTTKWSIFYGGPELSGIQPNDSIIDSGENNPTLAPHQWYEMALSTLEHQVEGSIQDTVVTSKNTSIRLGDSGFVTLGASAFVAVQFGHIHIEAIGPSWSVPEPIPVKASLNWTTLELGLCTPNGLTTDSERFDVTANWQIKHLASGKCVSSGASTMGEDEGGATLTLQDCVHNHPPQQFRNPYSVLRNGHMVALNSKSGGALCANKDGRVSLSANSPACASKGDSFAVWSLYPNTGQLRTSFGYDAKNGGRAHCLKAVQEEVVDLPRGGTQKVGLEVLLQEKL